MNLFVVVVLDPGNRKSAVFSHVTDPIMEFEQAECARMEPHIREAETCYRITVQRLQAAEKKAAKAKPAERPHLEQEARDIAKELSELRVPLRPRLVADDVTPEKLGGLLHDHGGRFAVLSPEGGIFELVAGRYSGASGPHFDVLLKGHAGDTLRVDRVGRPSEHVPRPALTVGLAVQGDVLRGLVSKPGFRGRGLLGRFLYALPKSTIGGRVHNAPPVPKSVLATYRRNVLKLLSLPWGTDDQGNLCAHSLRFTGAGGKRIQEFEAWLEPRLGEAGDLGTLTDWGGKLVGAAVRLAGILHVAENVDMSAPWTLPITDDTALRAIAVAKFYLAHAKAAFAEMGADPEIESARHVLAWIERGDVTTFSERDAFQGTRGRFKRVDALRPAMKLLLDHNYIRERAQQDRGGPGRPRSPVYEVNPLARRDSEDCEDSEEVGAVFESSGPKSSEDMEKEGETSTLDTLVPIDPHPQPPGDENTEEPPPPHNSHNPQNSITQAPKVCTWCRGKRFWLSVAGACICGNCHPPATPELVAQWIDGASVPGVRA